jgi:long-chain acyl-CoA synthetase
MSREQAHALLTAPGAKFEMEEKVIRGRPVLTWKNAPPHFRRLFEICQTYPDREFLVYENERATYPQFGKAVARLCQELIARGVKKGDRVALIMRNLPEWPVVYFASMITGAIVTPMNAWWTGPELHYGLTDCGAKVAIVDSERLERIAEHLDACPSLELVYVTRHVDEIAHPKLARLEDVIGKVSDWGKLPDIALPDVPLDPEDPPTIFYTSGTTGKPKGAMASHRAGAANVGSSGIANARSFLMAGEPLPNPDPHLEPQKTTLLVVPLFHVTGCFAVLGPLVAAGGKLILIRKWEPEQAMQIIEREKVNSTGGVPTIAWQLIEHPNRSKYDLSSLEVVSYGGDRSSPVLFCIIN